MKRDDNPLYLWRKKNRKMRIDVMAQLGVRSSTTIYYWEVGEITPPTNQMRAMAEMMGVGHSALAESWAAWAHA